MKKRTITVLTGTLLLMAAGMAQADSGVIGCQLKNGTQVWLDAHGSAVDYVHYNKAGDIDLRLPATAYGLFQGAGANTTTYYRFAKGDYSYVVIATDAPGHVWNGLTVYKGKKRLSQQSCQTYFNGELPEPSADNGTIASESDADFAYTP